MNSLMEEERDFGKLASESDVTRTVDSLKSHGINVFVVNNKEEALAKVILPNIEEQAEYLYKNNDPSLKIQRG